jgi:hypothetical protein
MGPRNNSLGNRWDDARYGSLKVISSDQTTATSRRPSSTRDTRIEKQHGTGAGGQAYAVGRQRLREISAL